MNWRARIRLFDFRGLLDVRFGEVHEHGGIFVADPVDLAGRDQDFLARVPVAGFDDQFAYRPALAVHHEAGHGANRSVGRMNVVTCHRPGAAQMNVIPLIVPVMGQGSGVNSGVTIGEPATPNIPPACQ